MYFDKKGYEWMHAELSVAVRILSELESYKSLRGQNFPSGLLPKLNDHVNALRRLMEQVKIILSHANTVSDHIRGDDLLKDVLKSYVLFDGNMSAFTAKPDLDSGKAANTIRSMKREYEQVCSNCHSFKEIVDVLNEALKLLEPALVRLARERTPEALPECIKRQEQALIAAKRSLELLSFIENNSTNIVKCLQILDYYILDAKKTIEEIHAKAQKSQWAYNNIKSWF